MLKKIKTVHIIGLGAVEQPMDPCYTIMIEAVSKL